MQESFENLGDDIDYSIRFIRDRQFKSVHELHAWAEKIFIEIDFHFTHASYTQKEGSSTISFISTLPSLW